MQRKRLLRLYFCPAKLFSSPTHVCHTVRMKYVDVYVHDCVFDECVYLAGKWACGHTHHCAFNCPLAEQPFVAFPIAVREWTCLSCCTTEESDWNPRKAFRIYRDPKGIVVKMLITMLTAMYMVVKVVESVRQLEWWNRHKSRNRKLIIIISANDIQHLVCRLS